MLNSQENIAPLNRCKVAEDSTKISTSHSATPSKHIVKTSATFVTAETEKKKIVAASQTQNNPILSSIKTPARPKSCDNSKTPITATSQLAKTVSKSTTPTSISLQGKNAPTVKTPHNSSMIKSREAVRIAKLQRTNEKAREVAEFKERLAKDKQQKLTDMAMMQRPLSARKLNSSFSSATSSIKKQDSQVSIFQRQKMMEQEQLAISLADRAHVSSEIERITKERRRQSIMLNTEIHKRAKDRELELSQKKKQSEMEILESRRQDCLSIDLAHKADRAKKRQSLAFRGQTFRRQKEIQIELLKAQQEEEASILGFRHLAWQGEQMAKQLIAEEEKKEVRRRADQIRRDRMVKNKANEDEHERAQTELMNRRDDWEAVQRYKERMIARRRESMQMRGEQAKAYRTYEAQRRAEVEEAEELQRFFHAQELEDIASYHSDQQARSRQSLVSRSDKAKQDKEYDLEQLVKDEEEQKRNRELMLSDRAALLEGTELSRMMARKSLQFRHQEELRDRLRLASERDEALAKQYADREAARQDREALQLYLANQREIRRQSAVARLMDSKRQHELDMTKHRQALDQLHEEIAMRNEYWIARQETHAEAKVRNRQSVVMRLASWKEQKEAETCLMLRKALEEEEDYILRRLDIEAMEAAQVANEDKRRNGEFPSQTRFMF